jgi:hypothetical protein
VENPGGKETNTDSVAGQDFVARTLAPSELTFSVVTLSNIPPLSRLVNHIGTVQGILLSERPLCEKIRIAHHPSYNLNGHIPTRTVAQGA